MVKGFTSEYGGDGAVEGGGMERSGGENILEAKMSELGVLKSEFNFQVFGTICK